MPLPIPLLPRKHGSLNYFPESLSESLENHYLKSRRGIGSGSGIAYRFKDPALIYFFSVKKDHFSLLKEFTHPGAVLAAQQVYHSQNFTHKYLGKVDLSSVVLPMYICKD